MNLKVYGEISAYYVQTLCLIFFPGEHFPVSDAENEELITNALNELTKGRTVIMIAHRLWTIADADNIVVLESGRASANGTHDELMESSSIYRRLWQMSLEAGNWNIAVKEDSENV